MAHSLQVVVVGRISSKVEENTRIIYQVNDNTSVFKVIFYLSNGSNIPTALKNFDYRENIYVRIYGQIRMFKEEKAIVGTKISEILKHDEITNHLLQVFVGHNIRTKGVLTPEQQTQGLQAAGRQVARGGASVDHSAQVLQLMKTVVSGGRFAHKQDLWAMLQSRMSRDDFEQSIRTLQDDGTIYTTVDENQFAVTE